MPIIKIKPQRGFALIPNETLRDSRLGLDTRGFLAELLTHTEDLDVSVEWLMSHFGIGRDKLFRMTKELKACGYLETPATTDEKGQFTGKEWVIYASSTVMRETRITAEADDSLKREDQREERRKENHMPSSRKSANIDDVVRVFDYWKQALNHPRAKLDAKRKKNIQKMLKEGHSAEDLEQAIRGIKLSPHHMGKNETGTVYDDIELICRRTSFVEKFMKLDEQQTAGPKPQSLRPNSITYASPEEIKWRKEILKTW